MRRPGHRERLRHHPERDAPLGSASAPAGRRSRLVELEAAIDLVDEQVGTGLGGDRDEGVVRRPVRQHAGRVVRGVDDDEPRRRRHLATQPVEVDRPAVALVELVEGHVGAGRPADLVQALVAGHVTMAWSPGPRSTLARQKIASSAPAKVRTSSGSIVS